MSSPSYMPVSGAIPNPQDGQHWPKGWSQNEVNAYYAIQHAAGSVHSPPLPSTSPLTLANYSFDACTALFNTDHLSSVSAGSYPSAQILGSPSSNGSQESAPPPLMTSPLGDDTSPYLPTPEHFFHALSNPFSITDGGSRLGASVQSSQDLIAHWLQLPGFSPPGQPPQDGPISADMLSISNQELLDTANDVIYTPPNNFVSTLTTALGLYYPDASQSLDLKSLSIKADPNASLPSAPEHVSTPARPAEGWTFRPVDPSPKTLRSKRAARNDDTPLSDVDTVASPSTPDAQVEPEMKCDVCGYVPLKKRKGDLHRHQMKHEAAHLSRVVCCGVPYTFSLASRHPGHLARWYANRPFYGGCGRTYSRMDALQRHMKKSGCLGGSARDHQAWRKLYFPVETRRRG
ncbi:hypothetical protein BC827DRAFT_1273570 [Russula dissimulans]|nr:hypothetical protein BC827DRAFT_1273570 [Russula dissimulans]